jgi:hypothetical protein
LSELLQRHQDQSCSVFRSGKHLGIHQTAKSKRSLVSKACDTCAKRKYIEIFDFVHHETDLIWSSQKIGSNVLGSLHVKIVKSMDETAATLDLSERLQNQL